MSKFESSVMEAVTVCHS